MQYVSSKDKAWISQGSQLNGDFNVEKVSFIRLDWNT